MSKSSESERYSLLGASSSKAGVLKAVAPKKPSHFIELSPDLAGDNNYRSFIHADGAGTKSIPAYIAFRETNDPSWFKGLAQDALVMNLDDIICVGSPDSMLLSNTIGRNKLNVPDDAIKNIIDGYKECTALLKDYGVELHSGGGETADVGDVVRTMIVDATIAGRIALNKTISTDNIVSGDVIIGLSSTGQASYETRPNSGISSNGLTLARHVAIPHKYADKYPEVLAPEINKAVAYKGTADIFAPRQDLGMSIIEALLSPTRTYAPILAKIYSAIDVKKIHGVINCTGGGQTKPLRFGKNVTYIKDSLFPVPPFFKLLQQMGEIPWAEMYSVFNMGHRIEIICETSVAEEIIKISEGFSVAAKQIGHVEASTGENSVVLRSEYGEFRYGS